MRMTREQKAELVTKFKTSNNDTASPEVQVSLLTHRINTLTEHFKTNVKDFSGRRGLLKLVSQRRSLLDYLQKTSADRYSKLISALNIRK